MSPERNYLLFPRPMKVVQAKNRSGIQVVCDNRHTKFIVVHCNASLRHMQNRTTRDKLFESVVLPAAKMKLSSSGLGTVQLFRR